MFEEWGFLLGELWFLILLAALLGLLAGWLMFGGGSRDGDVNVVTDELDKTRGKLRKAEENLDKCQESQKEKDARYAKLQSQMRDLQQQNKSSTSAETMAAGAVGGAAIAPNQQIDRDGDGVFEGKNEGKPPPTLSAPRDGQADNLKQIKGIGAKLEQICNEMGFYHFNQIAGWTAQEEAWVDANLEGFHGRVSRDGWIEQAKILAKGGETEFSRRVASGGVYED